MAKPKVRFQKGFEHYQEVDANAWFYPTQVLVHPNGWVHVTYQDGVRVSYPREAFTMIIGAEIL